MRLRPCPACRRHVAISATCCVFCANVLPPPPPVRPELPGRFSRAAVFAGATIATSACVIQQEPPPAPPPQVFASAPGPSTASAPPADAAAPFAPPVDAAPPPPPPVDAAAPPPPPDAAPAPAQTGVLRVVVRDRTTRKPIAGHYVYLVATERNGYWSILSDASGGVRFDGLAPGAYDLKSFDRVTIDGNNERFSDGVPATQRVRVAKKKPLDIEILVTVTRTNAIRAPIPMPYGAPPARRRVV